MKLLAVMAALVLALTSAGAALAQEGPVVTGQAQGVTLQPGATATLALVLQVKPGYHINGHAPDDDSMIPTKVTMTPAAGFKLLRAGYPGPSC